MPILLFSDVRSGWFYFHFGKVLYSFFEKSVNQRGALCAAAKNFENNRTSVGTFYAYVASAENVVETRIEFQYEL